MNKYSCPSTMTTKDNAIVKQTTRFIIGDMVVDVQNDVLARLPKKSFCLLCIISTMYVKKA